MNVFKLNQWYRRDTNLHIKGRSALLGAMAFVAALAVVETAPVSATPMVHSDESAFNAAVNGGAMTTEGFESLQIGQFDPVTLGKVTINGPGPGILVSHNPRYVTEGGHAVHWNAKRGRLFNFTFDTAINAFAIDITDLGTTRFGNSLHVSIDGGEFFDVFSGFKGANGNELFLGLFAEGSSFSSVTFAASSFFSDFVGFDRLRFGLIEATPVSEPATLALFGLGLMGLGALRRRKNGRTA